MKTGFKTLTLAALTGAVLYAAAGQALAVSPQVYCDDQARRTADSYRGNNAVGGAVAGAALGGLFGAVTGHGAASNTLTGVAVGGIAGALVGSTQPVPASNRVYWNAYNHCMAAYYPAPPPAYAPPPPPPAPVYYDYGPYPPGYYYGRGHRYWYGY